MKNGNNIFYRASALVMFMVFALVGIIFLLMPDGVIRFFNVVSGSLGMDQAKTTGYQFYLILSAAYMYIVTALAWLMFRHPAERIYPALLVQAKFISSILSFIFFTIHRPFLMYLANGVVDGAIALFVFFMAKRIFRSS